MLCGLFARLVDGTMTGIYCNCCHRSWNVAVAESLYLQLDLLSRPCPHCEAYTLSQAAPVAGRVEARFRPLWRHALDPRPALSCTGKGERSAQR
jgi:hypothetical protein